MAGSAADLPAPGAYEYGEFIAAGVLPFCVTDTGKVAPGSVAGGAGVAPDTRCQGCLWPFAEQKKRDTRAPRLPVSRLRERASEYVCERERVSVCVRETESECVCV